MQEASQQVLVTIPAVHDLSDGLSLLDPLKKAGYELTVIQGPHTEEALLRILAEKQYTART